MMHPSSEPRCARRSSLLCCLFLYAAGNRLLHSAASAAATLSAAQESTPAVSRCTNNYTMACVKWDVLALLDALDGERKYEIYPGITIVQRRSATGPVLSKNESADAINSSRLDYLIAKRLDGYADSVDLRVRLLNPINSTVARSVGHTVLERLLPFLRMSRKKKDSNGLFWATGTMAAIGTSALLALSSKALLTAGAALAIAIYSCMKGGGGGGGGGGKGGGSHLTATLMEESSVVVPHVRQCSDAVVDISGSHGYPVDVERYPGSRKTVEIVSPAMPIYRMHQDDYSTSYGPPKSQQYP